MSSSGSKWILLALGAIWCSRALAGGLPHFSVEKIADSADLIVVADVTDVRDLGATAPVHFGKYIFEAREYSAELFVLRTLKGPIFDKLTVSYSFPIDFVGFSSLARGTRLVFLHRNKDRYDLSDPYYSNFPATREPPEEQSGLDVSGLVWSNLLAVLASPTASVSEKRKILRVDYALHSNEMTIAALRKAVDATADRELRERLRGELVRVGDMNELAEVVDLLSRGLATENGRGWLLYVIGNCVKDPRAVQELQPLLSSPDDHVREAAVEALWHIGSEAAVPPLARMLWDSDQMVRFYAVRGLADIANEYGWGGPSKGEFREHEQKYLDHWREWTSGRAQ
ncbi:MAG TPA: HEAT repeat domain-containing protein [Terracidiphilus sp.]|nr:HEAT repeat domain-containing protein [Terracidiphilus sp.]